MELSVLNLGKLSIAYLVIFLVIAVGVWIISAIVALLVAPADRPWSFFWCTLLLLGPLGLAAALVAQERPDDPSDT